MKKTLARILSLVMIVTVLCGALCIEANALTIISSDTIYTDKELAAMPEITDLSEYGLTPHPSAARVNAVVEAIKPVLQNLAQYMPQSSAAQIENAVLYNYSGNSWRVSGYVDTEHADRMRNVLQAAIDTIPDGLDGSIDFSENQINTTRITEVSDAITNEGAYLGFARVGVATTGRFTDSALEKVRNGAFVLVQNQDVVSAHNIWLTNSMADNTDIKNIYLSGDVGYYGENTFRNSAVETVVFPAYWLSDHHLNIYTATSRTVNGIMFGKEAVIIEANSFADCDNLTSVIIPFEPARLYIADGVFANCPKLTVYAPAGGAVEKYCSENNIPFQAIADGIIEYALPDDAVPTVYVLDHVETITLGYMGIQKWERRISYYRVQPILNYTPTTDENWANYTNGIGIIRRMTSGTVADTITPAIDDFNRYRSDEINAQEIMDSCYGFTY